MRRRSALALVPLGLLLGSCSALGGDEAAPPEQALRTAETRFDEAGSVAFDLRTSAIPQGRDGVTQAKGVGVVDADSPRFEGQVTGVIQGTSAGVEIIAVDERTWMSFFTKDYNPVDMSDLGAPNPAEFFRPGSGVSTILAQTKDARATERSREGKVVLQGYAGTLPAAVVRDLFGLGQKADAFDVTYGIEPQSGELRRASVSGEFYPDATGTYTIDLSDYGTSVDIQPPA